jgi:hypothetical protein
MEILKRERRLLALLSQALELAEKGRTTMREVERCRSALREFYRELGMHP